MVLEHLKGHMMWRDRCLFILGVKTGFRISELLAIRVGDVYANGKVLNFLTVARKHMKKKVTSRTVTLNPDAKRAIETWVKDSGISSEMPLFCGPRSKGEPISRIMAWRILNRAFKACEMEGKLGTHCMRKTFAQKVHEIFKGDVYKTQKALGHASLNSTAAYLAVDQSEIDEAIQKI